MCVMGKNENPYFIRFLVICLLMSLNMGKITQKLKEQEFLFLPMTHFDKLSSPVRLHRAILNGSRVIAIFAFSLTDVWEKSDPGL